MAPVKVTVCVMWRSTHTFWWCKVMSTADTIHFRWKKTRKGVTNLFYCIVILSLNSIGKHPENYTQVWKRFNHLPCFVRTTIQKVCSGCCTLYYLVWKSRIDCEVHIEITAFWTRLLVILFKRLHDRIFDSSHSIGGFDHLSADVFRYLHRHSTSPSWITSQTITFNDVSSLFIINDFCRFLQIFSFYFYRAMHFSAKRGIAIACRLSVCVSVCLSVTLVDCDNIGWNSSKIISPLVSLGCSLFATPTWRLCSKGNTPKFTPKVTHPCWFERRRHSIANSGRMVTDSATVTMESL